MNPMKSGLRLASEYVFPAWFMLFSAGISGCGIVKTAPSAARQVKFDETDRRLVWPLPVVTTARMVSYYGERTDPLNGMQAFHTGVDLDGETGTPIHAAGAGRVSFSGRRSGYGLLLIIDHSNGLTTYYAHCSRLLLRAGNCLDGKHRPHDRFPPSFRNQKTRAAFRPFSSAAQAQKTLKYGLYND